jgi:hypothetical protein
MRTKLHGFVMLIGFVLMACVTGPQGLPTGQILNCPDGERQLLDCSMAFQQFARTLRFDLGIVKSSAIGFGLGAQNLINLDSITGDLLAHQRQICIDYNNCLLTKEEYKQETQYLRRAQLKIREAAYWAQNASGPEGGTQEFPSPPGIAEEEGKSLEGKSEYAVLDQLSSLNEELKYGTKRGKSEEVKKADAAPYQPIHFEYSVAVRRRSSISDASTDGYQRVEFRPGVTLLSGDQLKIRFAADRDGFLYIINFDSSGKTQIIFPHSEISLSNRIEAGKLYEIPDDSEQWYFLDNVPGKETMYLIAAPFQIQNLDQLVAHFTGEQPRANSRYQTARLRGALEVLTRGVGGIVKDEQGRDYARGPQANKVDNTVNNEFVSKVRGMTAIRVDFYHR